MNWIKMSCFVNERVLWVLNLNFVLTFWYLTSEDIFKLCEWEAQEIEGKMIDGSLGLYARSYGSLQQQIHYGFLQTT